MTDPDVQYLRDLAKGYANSFIDEWQEEHRRLNAIADRLESFIQAEAAKKVPSHRIYDRSGAPLPEGTRHG